MMNASSVQVQNVAAAAVHGSLATTVLDQAVEELKQARALANMELHRAIAGFREIFTTVPVEMRSNVLLKQAWAVHQALEVVRSIDAALAHLAQEHRSLKPQQLDA